MGLFNFLSKKNEYTQQELDFLREVNRAAKMYFNSHEMKLDLKGKNGEAITFIEAFPQIYEQCSQIKSPWDKRMMIFKGMDELYRNRIPPHIFANRLIEDRYANKAFEILKQSGEPENEKEQYFYVLSRALSILGIYDSAIEAAQKSLSLNPKFMNAKIALADAMDLNGMQNAAHEIYSQIMKGIVGDTNINSSEKALVDLLGIEGKGLRSPILAIDLLKSEAFSEDAWIWAEDEFYYSPYFRCQHAYWILQNKKNAMKSFAKLFSIVRDMPWVREAAINTMELYNFLDPDESKGLMTEDRIKLAKLIEANKWTSDGLYKVTLEL